MIGSLATDIGLSRKIGSAYLIEKDIVLHQLLWDISSHGSLSGLLLFKGGTCLIKHYLRYYRFSEDLDYTWRDQDIFRGDTRSQFERRLDPVLGTVGGALEKIASKRGFGFKWDKSDRQYVTLIGRGKFTTFKIHYDSEILGRRVFAKVQINFSDSMCFGHKRGDLRSLVDGADGSLGAKYDGYEEYASPIRADMYDIREILSEKIRAALTRRGASARDFVDAYMIRKLTGLLPEDVEPCAIKKTRFAIENFERYRKNFGDKQPFLADGSLFKWNVDSALMIEGLDNRDFGAFVARFQKYLAGLAGRIGGP